MVDGQSRLKYALGKKMLLTTVKGCRSLVRMLARKNQVWVKSTASILALLLPCDVCPETRKYGD